MVLPSGKCFEVPGCACTSSSSGRHRQNRGRAGQTTPAIFILFALLMSRPRFDSGIYEAGPPDWPASMVVGDDPVGVDLVIIGASRL